MPNFIQQVIPSLIRKQSLDTIPFVRILSNDYLPMFQNALIYGQNGLFTLTMHELYNHNVSID